MLNMNQLMRTKYAHYRPELPGLIIRAGKRAARMLISVTTVAGMSACGRTPEATPDRATYSTMTTSDLPDNIELLGTFYSNRLKSLYNQVLTIYARPSVARLVSTPVCAASLRTLMNNPGLKKPAGGKWFA
jgi:hypothetical protein